MYMLDYLGDEVQAEHTCYQHGQQIFYRCKQGEHPVARGQVAPDEYESDVRY